MEMIAFALIALCIALTGYGVGYERGKTTAHELHEAEERERHERTLRAMEDRARRGDHA